METFVQHGFFEWLWRASWQAAVLVVIVIGLQWLLREKVSPNWRHALWLLVIARLALPAAPETSWSIFNLANISVRSDRTSSGGASTATFGRALDPEPLFGVPASAGSDADARPPEGGTPNDDSWRTASSKPLAPASSAAGPVYSQPIERPRVGFRAFLAGAWAAGALFLCVRIALTTRRLTRRVAGRRLLTDSAALTLLEDCKETMGVTAPLTVVETTEVRTPVLYGFVRPRLLLPPDFVKNFNRDELRFIFLHELAHVKRGDIPLNWLTTALLILHWFNPLVWVAFARMRADREEACDALALSRVNAVETRSYGETILKLVQTSTGAVRLPAMAGIMEDAKQLERRIKMIARFKPEPRHPLGVALIAAAVAMLTLTDGRSSGGLSLAGSGVVSNPPQFVWVRTFGGSGDDRARATFVDGQGNVYVLGEFFGTVTFGTTTLTSAGGPDIFLSKFDPLGVEIWTRRIGGSGVDRAFALGTDAQDNIYVAGHFSETASFGHLNLTSTGHWEIFLAKYTPDGQVLWARRAGGVDQDGGIRLTVDDGGYVYLTGYFRKTADFGGFVLTAAPSPNDGHSDMYVARYDPDGNVQWARGYGGSGHDVAYRARPDLEGNLYVAGYFNATVDFDGTILTSTGGDEIFVAKFSDTGALLWIQQAGGTGSDKATDLLVDAEGNIYVAGFHSATASFGQTVVTGTQAINVFLAKYSSQGELLWLHGGIPSGSDPRPALAMDADGRIYLAGSFRGEIDLEGWLLTSGNPNALDIFVAKFEQDGTVLWATQAGGTASDFSWGLAVDAAGVCYLAGFFQGNAGFGPLAVQSSGSFDAFLAKLVEAPNLNVVRMNSQVRITWPRSPGFTLQSTDSLAPPIQWNPVQIEPVTEGELNIIVLSAADAGRFFRLKHP